MGFEGGAIIGTPAVALLGPRGRRLLSSDYPHVESAKDLMKNMLAKVEPLGEEIALKFFRTNAEWLLP